MARVLLGWELGGGLGHVGGLLPIAQGLAAQGHEPLLAVKDLPGALPVLQGRGFALLQAPLGPQKVPAQFTASSFADILAIRGFADGAELENQVGAWQTLLDLSGAKLVVSNFSPTLNL